MTTFLRCIKLKLFIFSTVFLIQGFSPNTYSGALNREGMHVNHTYTDQDLTALYVKDGRPVNVAIIGNVKEPEEMVRAIGVSPAAKNTSLAFHIIAPILYFTSTALNYIKILACSKAAIPVLTAALVANSVSDAVDGISQPSGGGLVGSLKVTSKYVGSVGHAVMAYSAYAADPMAFFVSSLMLFASSMLDALAVGNDPDATWFERLNVYGSAAMASFLTGSAALGFETITVASPASTAEDAINLAEAANVPQNVVLLHQKMHDALLWLGVVTAGALHIPAAVEISHSPSSDDEM